MACLFTDINDVVECYVIPTLGDNVYDYDVRGIAEAISYFDLGYRYGVKVNDQEGFRIIDSIQSGDNPLAYWDIVVSYRKEN